MSRRNRNIFIAIILSILFHLGLIFFIDFFDWLVVNTELLAEDIPDEITVVFPENKPRPQEEQKYIVENQNENEQLPDQSNLLSERNSRARNPEVTDQIRENTPQSRGLTETRELSSPLLQQRSRRTFNKPFSSDALTGRRVDPNEQNLREQQDQQEGEDQPEQQASLGNNQRYDQREFSVEEVGSLSLSTYAWEWAPYIQKLKIKHQRVWTVPPAYSQLGLISGKTKIIFEIARDGSLLSASVIDHEGHESLRISSLESIKAVFPFYPLPEDFPEQTLTINATLIYPDLRKLYNERRR